MWMLASLLWAGCDGLERYNEPRPNRLVDDGPAAEGGTESTEGTELPTDTGTEPGTTTTPPDPVQDGVACYLGEARDYATCLDVSVVASLPAAYDYPEPLSGSAQYLKPARYLDLDALDPGTRLAPNFLLSEVAQASKGQFGVVQTHAIDHLQAMRDELGALVINSGYRSPDYNAGVGGATWSRHMYGDAFDIDPVAVSLTTLAAACEGEGAGWVGVYETHVHCDWRDDPLDASFYPTARGVSFTVQPTLWAEIVQDASGLTAPAEGWPEGEPLREWTAYDAEGAVVATAVGRHWQWPDGASSIEVLVGRALVVRLED